MIYAIVYVGVALLVAFLVGILNKTQDSALGGLEAFAFGVLWPPALAAAVIVAPFWLAYWLGRKLVG